jgi:large subunit ribosomal protein L22
MEASASVRFVRITPQKARRAIDLIRGRQVDEARRILKFSTLGASRTLAKALDSAIANAEQRPGVVAQNLVVDRAWVDEGPSLKRFRPRAQGRAYQVLKRTSHITVVVKSMGTDEA